MLRRSKNHWARIGGETDKKTSLIFLGLKERLFKIGSIEERDMADAGRDGVRLPGPRMIGTGSVVVRDEPYRASLSLASGVSLLFSSLLVLIASDARVSFALSRINCCGTIDPVSTV